MELIAVFFLLGLLVGRWLWAGTAISVCASAAYWVVWGAAGGTVSAEGTALPVELLLVMIYIHATASVGGVVLHQTVRLVIDGCRS